MYSPKPDGAAVERVFAPDSSAAGSSPLWSVRAPDGSRLGPFNGDTISYWVMQDNKALPGMTPDQARLPPQAYGFCSVLGKPTICNKIPKNLYMPLDNLLQAAREGTIHPPLQEAEILAGVQGQEVLKFGKGPACFHRLTIDADDADTNRPHLPPAKSGSAYGKCPPGMRQALAAAHAQLPPPPSKPKPMNQGPVHPNSYDFDYVDMLNRLIQDLKGCASSSQRNQLLQGNQQTCSHLGTRPLPQGLGPKDYTSHLVAAVPQKGVTLGVMPLSEMVPTTRHTLTAGVSVTVQKTTHTMDQRLSLALLLDLSHSMASTPCMPGSLTSGATPSRLDASIQAIRGLVAELQPTSTFMLSTMTGGGARIELPPLQANVKGKHLAFFMLDKLAAAAAAAAAAVATPSSRSTTTCAAMRAAIAGAYGQLGSAGPPGCSDLCLLLFTDSVERTAELPMWEIGDDAQDKDRNKPGQDTRKKKKLLYFDHMQARLHTVFMGPQRNTSGLYYASEMTGGFFMLASSAEDVAAATGGLLAAQRYAQVLDPKLTIVTKTNCSGLEVLAGRNQEATIKYNGDMAVAEVYLTPLLAPGDHEQVLIRLDLPRAGQPVAKLEVLQATLDYRTPDGQDHMQEATLCVKRSPAWQDTQGVSMSVRELAASRKISVALLNARSRLEVADVSGAQHTLGRVTATRELPPTHQAHIALTRAIQIVGALAEKPGRVDVRGRLHPAPCDDACTQLDHLRNRIIHSEALQEGTARGVAAQLLMGASVQAFSSKEAA